MKRFVSVGWKGLPMSSHAVYKWANLILMLLALAALLFTFQFKEGWLGNSFIRPILSFVLGLWVGVTAYLGAIQIVDTQKIEYEGKLQSQKTEYEETIRSADADRKRLYKRIDELDEKEYPGLKRKILH
ncbi:MAG: hypothetical protein HYX81_03200 [Chloroflexi bacterium]|nr:hypothetical protein [Chloroflexota bacterium]MBI4267424.1 hypothetical protein [Chloroflexota bacterium]